MPYNTVNGYIYCRNDLRVEGNLVVTGNADLGGELEVEGITEAENLLRTAGPIRLAEQTLTPPAPPSDTGYFYCDTSGYLKWHHGSAARKIVTDTFDGKLRLRDSGSLLNYYDLDPDNAKISGAGTCEHVDVEGLHLRHLPVAPSNYYYAGGGHGYDTTGYAITANRIYAFPCLVPRKFSIDGLVGALNYAEFGCTFRLGLYRGKESLDEWGAPDDLVVSTGAISMVLAGLLPAVVTTTVLQPGLYWLAITSNSAGTGKFNTLTFDGLPEFGFNTSGTRLLGVYANRAYSALPASWPRTDGYVTSAAERYALFLRAT